MKNRLPIFAALDAEPVSRNLEIAERLAGKVVGFKIGPHLFWKEKDIACKLKSIDREAKLFLDLKFHDIPSTVARSIRNLTEGYDLFTFSLLAGIETARAAVMEASEKAVGVGVLTSMGNEDVQFFFGKNSGSTRFLQKRLFRMAEEVGVRKLVMAYDDLEIAPEGTLKIVPGIKSWKNDSGANRGGEDQKRSTSFEEALKKGADFVVVGRLLYRGTDPIDENLEKAREIWESIRR